jgi:hypothetical protein
MLESFDHVMRQRAHVRGGDLENAGSARTNVNVDDNDEQVVTAISQLNGHKSHNKLPTSPSTRRKLLLSDNMWSQKPWKLSDLDLARDNDVYSTRIIAECEPIFNPHQSKDIAAMISSHRYPTALLEVSLIMHNFAKKGYSLAQMQKIIACCSIATVDRDGRIGHILRIGYGTKALVRPASSTELKKQALMVLECVQCMDHLFHFPLPYAIPTNTSLNSSVMD